MLNSRASSVGDFIGDPDAGVEIVLNFQLKFASTTKPGNAVACLEGQEGLEKFIMKFKKGKC